jgi:hypothetical protein
MKRKKSVKEYVLTASYPLRDFPAYDRVLDGIVGKHHEASGAGNGMRDMDWYFKNRSTRDARFKKIKQLVTCKRHTAKVYR